MGVEGLEPVEQGVADENVVDEFGLVFEDSAVPVLGEDLGGEVPQPGAFEQLGGLQGRAFVQITEHDPLPDPSRPEQWSRALNSVEDHIRVRTAGEERAIHHR